MSKRFEEKEALRGFICEVADYMAELHEDAETLAADLKQAVVAATHLGGLRQTAGDMVEWVQDLT